MSENVVPPSAETVRKSALNIRGVATGKRAAHRHRTTRAPAIIAAVDGATANFIFLCVCFCHSFITVIFFFLEKSSLLTACWKFNGFFVLAKFFNWFRFNLLILSISLTHLLMNFDLIFRNSFNLFARRCSFAWNFF